MTNHLYDLLRSGATDPDKTFAELIDGRWYRYQDVDDVSARFANALVDLGVEPGDRVAVQVEKSVEAIMLYLGTSRAGAVFLPLNTAYTAAEIDYFIGDAEPRVFVCDPAKAECAEADRGARPAPQARDARRDGDGTPRPDVSAGRSRPAPFDDVARGPRRPRRDPLHLGHDRALQGRDADATTTSPRTRATLREAWRFTADDVLHPRAADLPHPRPVRRDQHGPRRRRRHDLPAEVRPRRDLRGCCRARPRMMGVPTFYTRLLAGPAPHARKRRAHMRLFVSGSAPLLAETHREWQARTGHAILERYGMTETNMNTSNPYDGDRVAGTVGFPLPGVEVRVADPETGARARRRARSA